MMNINRSNFTFASGGKISFKYATGSSLSIAIAPATPTPSRGYLSSTGQINVSKAQEELLLWYSIM